MCFFLYKKCNALQEMAVGLPQSAYKRRLQTTGRCCFSNKMVLSSSRKKALFQASGEYGKAE